MSERNYKVYDWDDEITTDGEGSSFETVILPEGTYNFTVLRAEKQRYDGSDKIPACNMVKIQLKIDGGELGTGLCFENIYAYEKMEWKAASFLRSVGLKKHGEKTSWRKLCESEGLTGRCRITKRSFEGRNGQVISNQVDKYFDKEEQKTKKTFTAGVF